MVICLERSADLHMAQLMPLPLAVSCFSKIEIGFTFLVPAHLAAADAGRCCYRAHLGLFTEPVPGYVASVRFGPSVDTLTEAVPV